MKYYSVRKIWPDSIIYILGNGPNLELIKDSMAFKDRRVIAVNSAFKIGDFVDALFFGDAKWYWWNRGEVQNFKGLKFTLNICRGEDKSVAGEKGIHILKRGGLRGIDINPQVLCWNRSSGGAAINLAVHLGAKKIVLIGFDMRRVNNQKNCFPNFKELSKPDPYLRMSDYGIWSQVQKAADRLGVKIVNATPNSQLPCFAKIELEALL